VNRRHLILGELTDVITGRTLPDTHDERYRQKIARLLLEEKGYSRSEISPGEQIAVRAGDAEATVRIDYVIRLSGRTGMLVRYGPGSVVSRQRPALAASRLVAPYQVPVVVVTNGEEADVMDGHSGTVTGQGFPAIPSRQALDAVLSHTDLRPIPAKRAEVEQRLLYTYDVLDACACGPGTDCPVPAG